MLPPERRCRLAVHAVTAAAVVATAAGTGAGPAPVRLGLTALILSAALTGLHAALDRLATAQRRRWASEHDALTRLLNRDRMTAAVTRAWQAARRDGRPLALVLVDADRLGALNAAFGRPVGDRVLAEIAEACRRAARPGDVWGRWHGGRFLGVLADADGRTALILAEQIRAAVARVTVATREGVDVRVTASAGVAADGPDHRAESADDLVDTADRALYAAKRAGRDRVTSATPPRLPATPLAAPALG
jgi:diguanylate cyclase (GGDEF)-like protein